MKIGIAVTTTPSRERVFQQWHEHYTKTTLNVDLYIHNDLNYQGVVYSKNKCLAALEDYDHIFLIDDDCFPVIPNWHLLYINSGLNHACWNYNRELIGYTSFIYSNVRQDDGLGIACEYEKPNGCMLYIKSNALDFVGGFDKDFIGYGYEHVNWSDRIFNIGLTPARYIDIPNSKGLFKMADCESSFKPEDRLHIPSNYELYQQKFYSKEFKPYK